jgi:hypothetical protein
MFMVSKNSCQVTWEKMLIPGPSLKMAEGRQGWQSRCASSFSREQLWEVPEDSLPAGTEAWGWQQLCWL